MPPKKSKSSRAFEDHEKPAVSVDMQELEARIRENAEELRRAEMAAAKDHKKEAASDAEKLKQNMDKVKANEGVIGYILRNSTSASIDLKDPARIIDYAVLSSSTAEASDELSSILKLGDIKQVVVEGKSAKLLFFANGDNKVSVFMEKSVDHKRLQKDLLG